MRNHQLRVVKVRKIYPLMLIALILGLSSPPLWAYNVSDDDEVFLKVTNIYGPLKVQAGSFKKEADIIPWSSWWYPLWEKTLFEALPGKLSTLQKYDYYVEILTGVNPRTNDYEKEHFFDPRAVAWAGRCDAWALASIYSPEPKNAVIKEGIQFDVQDLKALAIKSYEYVEGLDPFGQRFNGEWDNVYKDIYPDQFHRFFQGELFEKGQPFIMDHDAGVEVWNTPVYKVMTKITEDPGDQNVMHVKTWVFTADSQIRDLNYVGTETVIRTYTYDLFGEKNFQGEFVVESGEWTEESRWEHPDYLIPRTILTKRQSLNAKLDVLMVDRILKGSF